MFVVLRKYSWLEKKLYIKGIECCYFVIVIILMLWYWIVVLNYWNVVIVVLRYFGLYFIDDMVLWCCGNIIMLWWYDVVISFCMLLCCCVFEMIQYAINCLNVCNTEILKCYDCPMMCCILLWWCYPFATGWQLLCVVCCIHVMLWARVVL